MTRILIIIFSLCVLAACATPPVKQSGLIEIKPSGIHEECATVRKGQNFMYSFHSSLPVDFSVHYHEGEKIYYPIEIRGIATLDGTYMADHEDIYCLMWTSRQKVPVTLNYKYEIRSIIKEITPEPRTRPGSIY